MRSSRASVSMAATAGNLGASMAATLSTWSMTSAPVGWAKMVRMAAATISAEPLGPGPGHCAGSGPGSVPAGASHDRGDGLLQTGVGIGDDQLDAGEPAGLERAQERGPERAVLAVTDVQAQHLPTAISGHPVAITTARETTRPSTRALR